MKKTYLVSYNFETKDSKQGFGFIVLHYNKRPTINELSLSVSKNDLSFDKVVIMNVQRLRWWNIRNE